MKYLITIFGFVLIASIVNISFADSSLYEIKGTGAAVVYQSNPQLYVSSLRIVLSNSSSIDSGSIIVRGGSVQIFAKILPEKWSFSYNDDGSFHGEGPVVTRENISYDIVLDGTRTFATGSNSMWKISAVMQGNGEKFVLEYLIIGKDPSPAVNVSVTDRVLIPNGNSNATHTGFFLPLNLEIIRGTTVVWQNEDNIGHTVQSQDGQGNVISMFNSGILKTGDTFSYKFDKPGVYHYFCTIHPWRVGMVTVS